MHLAYRVGREVDIEFVVAAGEDFDTVEVISSLNSWGKQSTLPLWFKDDVFHNHIHLHEVGSEQDILYVYRVRLKSGEVKLIPDPDHEIHHDPILDSDPTLPPDINAYTCIGLADRKREGGDKPAKLTKRMLE